MVEVKRVDRWGTESKAFLKSFLKSFGNSHFYNRSHKYLTWSVELADMSSVRPSLLTNVVKIVYRKTHIFIIRTYISCIKSNVPLIPFHQDTSRYMSQFCLNGAPILSQWCPNGVPQWCPNGDIPL